MLVENNNYTISDDEGTLITVNGQKATVPEGREDEAFLQRETGLFKNGTGVNDDKAVFASEGRKNISTPDANGLKFRAADKRLLLKAQSTAKKASFEIDDENSVQKVAFEPRGKDADFTVEFTDPDSPEGTMTVKGVVPANAEEGELLVEDGVLKTDDLNVTEIKKDGETISVYNVTLNMNGHGTEKDAVYALPAVRAHDDHVGFVLFGYVEDLFGRVADDDFRLRFHAVKILVHELGHSLFGARDDLAHEAVDGLCVEGQSDILPEVVAVTTRAVTRAIRDINCQCHFVWYLLKYDACIDVLQHKAIGMVPLALNLGSLESCMGVESASGLLLTGL